MRHAEEETHPGELEAPSGGSPLSGPGAPRRGPRPPYRPGIPALQPGVPAVQPFEIARGRTPARYVGEEVPGERVMVFTIHDGNKAPADLPGRGAAALAESAELRRAYRRERDWGANLVGRHLARHLGLGGYVKVEVARAVLDLGRLPGCSPPGVPHLKRRAIFAPTDGLLSQEAKHHLLAEGYDRIDGELRRRMAGKQLSVAIHTYDPYQADGTLRPELSLISGRPERRRAAGPVPLCDPHYPMRLCDSVCDGGLVRQALLDLGGGWQVAHNRPYEIHEGSVEFRSQARSFFEYLRRRFHAACPQERRETCRRVWEMLLDVNRRSADHWALRCYLQGDGAAPAGLEWIFADARRAYREIERWAARHEATLLRDYRASAERVGSLALEVRKDLLCELDDDGEVAGLRVDAEQTARDIARALAGAVAGYVRRTLPAARPAALAL